MCPFHSSVVSINVNWQSLLSPIATIMRRLYFLLYISTFFSSVPNRCIPDQRQLPSNAAPKHTTTYGDVIQIKQAYRGKKKKKHFEIWFIYFFLPTVDLLQWHRQWNPHEQWTIPRWKLHRGAGEHLALIVPLYGQHIVESFSCFSFKGVCSFQQVYSIIYDMIELSEKSFGM